jgi:GTP pyrophosphokinase
MGRDIPELALDSLFIEKIKSGFSAEDADLLVRAHAFSKKLTCSPPAEPYQAAGLLLDQEADAVTIAAALLVPFVQQGRAHLGEIRKHVDPAVSRALEDLKTPFLLRIDSNRYHREDVQALLTSMGNVPRQAILMIVFRLLALENAVPSNEPHLRQMARETLDLYVPIANRLSLGKLCRRLEDTSFRILDPEGYAQLRQKVAPIQAEDDHCLHLLMTGVKRLLENNGVQGSIQGRTKSLYGIRCKMDRTGQNLEEIMDRIGFRIIVGSVPECYAVLGLLHAHFMPIPGTFDDYIGLPKQNGYQSLHTCIYPVREVSHKPIEFQIRTELMHKEAEHGAAAHWRYKSETLERDRQSARWMEGLVRQHREAASSEAFIELLHRQVFRDHLVVFGNGGRIVRLADNATVLDYLKIINVHAPEEVEVKVNGRAVSLDCALRDGDSIELLTDGQSVGSEAAQPRLQKPLSDMGACRLTDQAFDGRESPARAVAGDPLSENRYARKELL